MTTRNSFSRLDKLKMEKEELYFTSSVLIEEVEYYKNHISLREVAVNGLGMRLPINKERVLLFLFYVHKFHPILIMDSIAYPKIVL